MGDGCEHFSDRSASMALGYGECRLGDSICTRGRAALPEECLHYWRARADAAENRAEKAERESIELQRDVVEVLNAAAHKTLAVDAGDLRDLHTRLGAILRKYGWQSPEAQTQCAPAPGEEEDDG